MKSTVTSEPATTVAAFVCVTKPVLVTVTLYAPGARPAKEYEPSAAVVVDWPLSVAAIAPATAALPASFTEPLSPPVVGAGTTIVKSTVTSEPATTVAAFVCVTKPVLVTVTLYAPGARPAKEYEPSAAVVVDWPLSVAAIAPATAALPASFTEPLSPPVVGAGTTIVKSTVTSEPATTVAAFVCVTKPVLVTVTLYAPGARPAKVK